MDNKKLKVLVVSYLPWRNDVSVGNTLSNLFQGLEDRMEFANIYFKGGMPNNSIAKKYYYIPEKMLAKSIVTRKTVGKEVFFESTENETGESNSASYNKARQLRWDSMLLAQDIIGLLGKWKSHDLDRFVAEYNPDIIFGPLGRVPVANNVMTYLHNRFSIPIVTYAWDDHYSLHKRSFSPFFWIKTFVERRYIYKCAKKSEFLYTITEAMQQEYSVYFNKKCKILYKGYDFGVNNQVLTKVNSPKKIIYMGNIGSGRWRVLAKVAKALKEININEKKAELFIYTMSPKSDIIENSLNIPGASYLMDPVLTNEVMPTMKSADLLLHVEPTNRKELSFFRLSFSTKIVDYLYSARCIIAIGGNTAAMDYLKKNDAAIVEVDDLNLVSTLEKVLNNEETILEYAQKAWNCGVNNHQLKAIQDSMYNDFCNLLTKNKVTEGVKNENR